jgi:hypothetical protein
VLVGTVVGLLLAEGTVRLFSDRLLSLSHPAVRFDPALGWVQRAGQAGVRKNEAGQEVVLAGSTFGIREPPRPYDFAASVLLLGDSFTAGTQIPFEETWGARLQERLRRRRPQVEVVNAGVDRYDLAQEYRLAERLWPAVHPVHLVVALYLGNDLLDYTRNSPARPPWESGGVLHDHSYLYHFVTGALSRRPRGSEEAERAPSVVDGWSPRSVPGFAALRPDQQARIRGQFASGDLLPVLKGGDDAARRLASTEGVLTALAELAKQHGIGMTLVVLPMKQEVIPEQHAEWLALHGLSGDAVEHLHRTLAAWAARTRVAFVDVTAALRMHESPAALYWLVDSHMTPRGHAVVAEAAEAAVEEGWGRPIPGSGSASPTSSR